MRSICLLNFINNLPCSKSYTAIQLQLRLLAKIRKWARPLTKVKVNFVVVIRCFKVVNL